MMRLARLTGTTAVALLIAVGAVCGGSGAARAGQSLAPSSGKIVGMRRLTEAQYRQSIADIFGTGIKIQGRFEPEVRREGLIAVGSAEASISAGGMEQYYAMASDIAHQAVSDPLRAALPCKPAAATAADEACVRAALNKYARLLYRRPVPDRETAALVTLADHVATDTKDFYAGLEEALGSLIASPQFLFRIERAAGTPGKDGTPLDAYARAARLSYFFWNTTPDEALLQAAERGELMTKDGLARQVERLAGSPKAAAGLGAFFDDMLQLDLFRTQSKDSQYFPKYSQVLASQAREQTIRTVVDLLLTKNGDYRDIFTTRDTFMTRTLAMVYKVPYTSHADWAPYRFDAPSGRSGVLTQISFLSLFSHPARSSPTKRGVALNEVFLCETTPTPPGNVDFSAVNGAAGTVAKTVRLRLEAHRKDETCAGCHAEIDPPGLALERFDSLGEYRETEGGEPIDVRSDVDGVSFEGATGLGRVLHDNPRTSACVVRNLYKTGVGRTTAYADKALLDGLTKTFVDGGYKVPAFMKALALSEAMYTAKPAPKAPAAAKVATNVSRNQEVR